MRLDTSFPESELRFLGGEMGDDTNDSKPPLLPANTLFTSSPAEGSNAGAFETEPPGVDSLMAQEPEAASEKLEIIDKLRTVYEEYGFIPASQEELTEIWEIRKYRERPSGVAMYLNRVLLHQKRDDVNSSEPEKDPVSKVNNWIEWRSRTRGNKHAVDYVTSHNAGSPLGDTDLMRDGFYKRGYKIMQSTATRAAMIDGRIAVGSRPYAEEEVQIEDLSPEDTKSLAWQTCLSEEARNVFWSNVILEARNHLLVRPMADEAIASFKRPVDR